MSRRSNVPRIKIRNARYIVRNRLNAIYSDPMLHGRVKLFQEVHRQTRPVTISLEDDLKGRNNESTVKSNEG